MRRPVAAWWWAAALAVALACALPASVTPTLPPPAATLATSTSLPTATAVPPSVTASSNAPPTETFTPSPVPPTDTPSPPATLGPTTLGRSDNFTQIGHNALDSRGWNAGLALNYPCAYLGNRAASRIEVFDVSDPANPALVNELPLPPARYAVEVRAVPDLNLLVAMSITSDLEPVTHLWS